MTKKSEGRYEIEAAKARLAAARDRTSSTKESVRLAEAMLQQLKSQLMSSNQEVEEAETCLKAAERRWEVIGISDGGDSPVKDNRNKRRKVSLSPWGNNENTATAGRGAPAPSHVSPVAVGTNDSDGARQRSSHIQRYAGNIARSANSTTTVSSASTGTSEANGVGPRRESAPSRTVAGQASNAITVQMSTNTSVQQPMIHDNNLQATAHKGAVDDTSLIIVNGAGTSNVNGTYYEHGKSYGGASSYQRSAVDEDGEVIVFSIVRRARRWWIGSGAGNRFPTKIYYRTVFAHNAERPPLEEPWGVFEEGIDPAPNLQNEISGNNKVGSSSSSGNSQRSHLTDAAKLALRQAILSAIDNPNGEIEPRCLQLAMAQGLLKLDILNAAVVARNRYQSNREQRRLQQHR